MEPAPARRAARGRPDALDACHPLVALVFFALAVGGAVLFLHPVASAVSLAGGIGYSVWLEGRRAVRFALVGMLPLFAVAALFNPLFSHAGQTVLARLPGGSPLTLESAVFGVFAAAMIVTVIIWFTCFNRVLTADKLHYLFGRLAPALGLVFAMTLRLAPRLKTQVRRIAYAQRGLGAGAARRDLVGRARQGLAIISILTTWALENSIETADSMRARGFGAGRRTSFHRYRMDRRDRATLAWLAAATGVFALATAFSLTTMQFYPVLAAAPPSWLGAAGWLAYTGVVLTPLALDALEELRWRRTRLSV
ncbi:MAG: energy-coupling factor transporter transmembrane protein EcfT [Bifidobacteriaceae bacterium]|nr:energy-coupling factor transporter transmembrane protein EcfT [Bifidobacteriaceae bacterium]